MSFMRFSLKGAVAAGALLFGAVTAMAGNVRVTIAEYSAKTGPYFAEVEKAFEAENPGTDIQIEVVPWDTLRQKLDTDIAAGANADLAIIGTRWILDFVKADVIEPMDALPAEVKGRFIDTFLTPATIEGKMWGLPVAASARAMYYNKELFEKAGVQPPKTWDEVMEAAKKISALGNGIAGFGMQGKEIETDVYFYYAMWSEGGDIIGADGKSGLTSDAAVKAAELYKALIDAKATQEGVTAYNREDVQNMFKKGQVGMMMTAPFLSGQIKAEAPNLKYGVIPVPAGSTSATYGVTDSIILFKNSKVKDEAMKFLEFAFRDEWRKKFDVGEGFLPVTKAVAAMPEFQNNEDLKVFASLLPSARFAPLIAGWEEIAQTTSDALQAVYLGKAEPKAALEEAAAKVNTILGK